MTLEQVTEALVTLDSQRKAADARADELDARIAKLEKNPLALTQSQVASLEHVGNFLGFTADQPKG